MLAPFSAPTRHQAIDRHPSTGDVLGRVTRVQQRTTLRISSLKTILAAVVGAEKTAEARVIRRREENGATRSLLNTAKVMEDNDGLVKLR
jgi:regulator of protease activity HflC (stomatin/prohibitin superfamily)